MRQLRGVMHQNVGSVGHSCRCAVLLEQVWSCMERSHPDSGNTSTWCLVIRWWQRRFNRRQSRNSSS